MRLLIILFLISGMAYGEGPNGERPIKIPKQHKIKNIPPNCMIIGGQLRCWVIDPLPLEWPPEE
jgi:hypothetical protein